jgi:Fe2+ transport system protein FeoA
MAKKVTVLANLPANKKAKIVSIHQGHHGGRHKSHHGGHHFNNRMCAMGVREGQIIEVVSKQPFFGPITVSIGKCKMTIGRGMAHKIIVEIV